MQPSGRPHCFPGPPNRGNQTALAELIGQTGGEDKQPGPGARRAEPLQRGSPALDARELMRELGCTPTPLYRYLKSLKESGLLMSARGGRFSLGPRVVEMDYLSRRAGPAGRRRAPHLARLTAAYTLPRP